jgi:hypothetical protein
VVGEVELRETQRVDEFGMNFGVKPCGLERETC